jgi:hypothetical protein
MPSAMRLIPGLLFLVGCSSSSFEVAQRVDFDTGSVGTDDTGVASDTGTSVTDSGTTVTDSGTTVTDSGTTVVDAVSVDGSTGCAAPSEVTEVWVDAVSTAKGPNGTVDCPFRHITDAISYINTLPPKARTIRVRAGTYAEGAALVLKPGISLKGAGIGVTTLSGGGTCMGIGNCIVRLEGGALIESVTVDAGPTAKHGIVTGGTDGGFPIIKNVKVTGAVGDGNAGILSSSGSNIGPNVDSSGNRYGLVIWGNQKVTISGGNNHFDNNAGIGINHEGTGQMFWTGGGTANGNPIGVKLGDTAGTLPPTHGIDGATITGNLEIGIRLTAVAGLKLRNSTLTENKVAIFATLGTSNTIDLGATGDNGNNVFQRTVGPALLKNTNAAVCITGTRALAAPMRSNTWTVCAPAVKSLDSVSATTQCDGLPSYADVWYRGLTAPDATCPG